MPTTLVFWPKIKRFKYGLNFAGKAVIPPPYIAALAQLVEHRIRNAGVRCSSHLSSTTFPQLILLLLLQERPRAVLTLARGAFSSIWEALGFDRVACGCHDAHEFFMTDLCHFQRWIGHRVLFSFNHEPAFVAVVSTFLHDGFEIQ